jgi:hypothetical protein
MPNESAVRLRQAIEEQLGEFRACADLPATEIEAMAERLARAVEPFFAAAPQKQSIRAA